MNYKKIIILLTATFATFGQSIPYSSEDQEKVYNNSSTFHQKSKKYNLSVCAIIKNEGKYLNEWIEFHRLIGVEHFYLYSNDNFDLLQTSLKPYIKKGVVTLIPWVDFFDQMQEQSSEHWALATQIPAYENAIKFRAIGTTKWLALLNTDEYLLPVHSYMILDLLEKYDSYPAITLETDVFDGSKVTLSPAAQLLIEAREWIQSPATNIYKEFNKLILKPELCVGFAWPPYEIKFKNDQEAISLARSDLRINRYVNRNKPFIDPVKRKLYINSRFMPRNALSELLNQGYAIEDDEQTISRYLPELKKKCIGNEK
jgi:Glycosyltransferase family 92